MESIKVSIIVPVYNVEQFLYECLDSVLSQTYNNIEAVLVDDGSTDNSGKLCDTYSKKDSRIKVIHQKNQGLSAARNTGIDAATGDYLLFVDSDDVISEHMVEDLLRIAVEHKIKFVSSPLAIDKNNLDKNVDKDIRVFSSEDALKSIFEERVVQTSASGKLYAKELWETVRFPVGKLFEDYATIYKIVLKCDRIVSVGRFYYFYRPNPNGITGSFFSKRKLDYFEITNQIIKDLEANNLKRLIKTVNNRTKRYAISFYRDMSRSSFDDKEIQAFLVKIIRKHFFRYYFTRYAFTSKLYGSFIAMFPNLALKVFRK